MPLKISKAEALAVVREEAAQPDADPEWVKKVEHLSKLCDAGVSKTHVAFLGTAILAKSINRSADLFAIKPHHAQGNPNAFSARTLCHSVLVPLAAEIGISLGVTGREPLNNQPYFRMTRLDDGTPVHAGGKAAFDYMLELVTEIHALPTEANARAVLRAYISVRRQYLRKYASFGEEIQITPERLVAAIEEFVQENTEGGRRAQAVVAGLLDVFAGTARVESGRINDPSRKYPGDVCVRASSDHSLWEKAFEVRDKPVTLSDAQIFGKKCAEMAVREGAILMASRNQKPVDTEALSKWCTEFGIGLTLFTRWTALVEQVLFWAEVPKPVGAAQAAEFIHRRLVAVEASPNAVDLWKSLIG